MREPSEWVAAGASADDPAYSPGNELWGIPALRNRDLLYPRDPYVSATRAISGVNMTGVVPGVLYDWILSDSGVWYECCQFTQSYWDGRDSVVELRDQLVPQHACDSAPHKPPRHRLTRQQPRSASMRSVCRR